MKSFSQFRPADFPNNCQTALPEQLGMVPAATEESDEHRVSLSNYFLDGFHLKVFTGELLQPLDPEPLPQGATVSLTQQAIIQQIITCSYQGALRKLFLEARFLDLFIEQHTQLTTTQLPSCDRDLLHAVRNFLDQNYAEPPGLLALARQFGTNDFKLKKGFKELFGTTVFGYVAERRLTVAHQLLVLTDQPVQEIAETVGFTNPAHFATAFRRRFGLRPTQVRCSPQPYYAEI